MPSAWLALLLALSLGWVRAAAAAAPAPTDCFDCPWLELPLDEWTAKANGSRSETLPWGQVVTFHPIDYRRLGEELCECVLDSLEGPLGTHQPPQHFVQTDGTRFVLHGKPLRFSGFNAAQALSWAASGDPRLLADLMQLFADAASLGLKVGRVWATANGPKVRPPFLDVFNEQLVPANMSEPPWVTLQPEPGVLNETVLQALDHILDLAQQNGVKLVLTLADYHARFGSGPAGVEPFMQWVHMSLNLSDVSVSDFYSDERVKLLYRLNLCQLANRVSSRSGVKYKDTPMVFAWDLISEPRCPACPGSNRSAALSGWVDEMSAFMRCIDPNHLWLAANGGSRPVCFGQDWAEIARLPHIGYGSAHMYQSMRGSWDDATRSECGWECAMACIWEFQWGHTCLSRFGQWLQAHIQASGEAVGKPFILEEWGKQWSEEQRNQMFQLVQDTFRAARAANASSPAAGAMFWGATAGEHIDWDGWQVRLDGGRTVAPPFEAADKLRQAMPPEQQQWLADVDAMQAAFRHDKLASLCMDQAKQEFASLFSGYSSNSTLEIVRGMVADAASVGSPSPATPASNGVAAADGGT
ncbi:hypothetical protein COHA_007621 [Chlorella ohadii]|uniref:mannan endo-1,4-beta-mannosidase n=1 Tax=Chlorella ohadii TaxID=2649997 RepID=A0AAD5DLG8_9CHLO|nr:hypothetical protein COHA_007621 [Chlorella ohadii]